MPRRLSAGQLERFLTQRRVAVLATLNRGGSSVLTPIWYLYRNGLFFMRTGEASVKAQNVRRDPRVSLCVQDERPPYRSVTVYGTASLEESTEGLDADMARRYLGAIGGHFYLRTARAVIEESAEATLVLKPQRIVSQDFSQETPLLGRLWLWAKRILPPGL